MKTGRRSNTAEKFHTRYRKLENGCWEWTGSHANPYGKFKLDGKYWSAHRISYILANGPIAETDIVCHKCDNPYCVNPDHLFIGTTADNVHDRVTKGRSAIAERNVNSKLTREQVVAIRAADLSARGAKTRLAVQLGISVTALCYVLKRKNWRHL